MANGRSPSDAKRQPKSGTTPNTRNGRGARRQIVLPGQYVFASVRVAHRRYLLRPTRNTKNAFQYFLAECSKKWGIRVFAACVMSNHYHLVIRDVRGEQPNFFRDLNRMLAQYIKAEYKTHGNIFRSKPNRVVLHHPVAVADKIAYTLANPVSAAAVRFPHEWPGFRTRIKDMGLVNFGGTRPRSFFGKRKTMRDRSDAPLYFPECLVEFYGSREDAASELHTRLEHHVERAQKEVRDKGWTYLGARRAQTVSPFKQATSWEVFGALVPAFATLGLSIGETIEVKQKYIAFQRRYDECRERLLRGEADILWPPGTWAMVRLFGQRAAA